MNQTFGVLLLGLAFGPLTIGVLLLNADDLPKKQSNQVGQLAQNDPEKKDQTTKVGKEPSSANISPETSKPVTIDTSVKDGGMGQRFHNEERLREEAKTNSQKGFIGIFMSTSATDEAGYSLSKWQERIENYIKKETLNSKQYPLAFSTAPGEASFGSMYRIYVGGRVVTNGNIVASGNLEELKKAVLDATISAQMGQIMSKTYEAETGSSLNQE